MNDLLAGDTSSFAPWGGRPLSDFLFGFERIHSGTRHYFFQLSEAMP